MIGEFCSKLKLLFSCSYCWLVHFKLSLVDGNQSGQSAVGGVPTPPHAVLAKRQFEMHPLLACATRFDRALEK